MKRSRVFPGLAAWALVALSPLAGANVLTNGSFETPASAGSPSLEIGSSYLSGWTVIQAEIAQVCDGCFGFGASDGGYFLDLAGYHDASPYGGVMQVFATTPGTVYDIAFDVGAAGGTTLIQVSVGNLTTTAEATGLAQTWTRFSSSFTATASLTTLTLTGLQPSASNTYIGLDNVVVSVPEPAAIAQFGAGVAALLALAGARRRGVAG